MSMKKNNKMWELMGHIDSSYIDEARTATRLGRSARRRWMSLGHIAAVFVGLAAVSVVVMVVFWFGGTGMFQQPYDDIENGPEIEMGELIPIPTPEPEETTDPYIQPTPSPYAERAIATAALFLRQFPSLFFPVTSTAWGDTSEAAYIFVWGDTLDDAHYMDAEGNILRDVPFIDEDLLSIAVSYRLYDDGSGVPIIFIHFQSFWVTSSFYAMYQFDGTEYVFVDIVAGFGGTMTQIEGRWIYPFIDDTGRILIYSGDQLGGVFREPTPDQTGGGWVNAVASYGIAQRYEWGDEIHIYNQSSNWEPVVISREEFDAIRLTPEYFSLFPDLPEGNFRLMEPMADLEQHFTNTITPILQEHIRLMPQRIYTPSPILPSSNLPYEYLEAIDDRTIEYLLNAIRDEGFAIRGEEPLEVHWDLLGGGVFFRIEGWAYPNMTAQIFEFHDIRARVTAFDQVYERYGYAANEHIWIPNGKFIIETNNAALSNFFATIP